MKKFCLFFYISFFFFSSSLAENNIQVLNKNIKYLEKAPENSIVDAILFSINGQAYSLMDLKKFIFLSGVRNPNQACISYITSLLIENKAKELGGKIPEEAIQKAINDILKRNHMDISTLKVILEAKNISFEDFKKFIKLQLFVTSYVRDFGKPNIKDLAQEFKLEIYEPLCFSQDLKDFYVPKYLESLNIENNTYNASKTKVLKSFYKNSLNNSNSNVNNTKLNTSQKLKQSLNQTNSTYFQSKTK